jgi:hypothetical protein
VQPESPLFFTRLAQRLERGEEDAVRRWRRTAFGAAAVALAAITVAGVAVATPTASANVVDLTVRCTNAVKGGLPVFDVHAAPTGSPPIDNGKIRQPPPGFAPVLGLWVQTGDVAYILSLTSLAAGYSLDRRTCVPDWTKLKLAPGGLPKNLTLTSGDAQAFEQRCADVGRMIMRVRIANDSFGAPVRAQLLIVRAKTHKPLIYVDWGRNKVTAWAVPDCDRTR